MLIVKSKLCVCAIYDSYVRIISLSMFWFGFWMHKIVSYYLGQILQANEYNYHELNKAKLHAGARMLYPS